MQENEFENVIYKMVVILPRFQRITVECRYNAVWYNEILHKYLQ